MAGISKKGNFHEKISPFLRSKMEMLKKEYGEESEEYRALFLQYCFTEKENYTEKEENIRHWQADVLTSQSQGVERLYNKSVVIEPTMICAAHCRYCLRANYQIFTLSEDEIITIAKFCGSKELKNNINEVLITGGDPFIVPRRLIFLIESLIEFAPNIKIARIATRLPLHDPTRVDNNIYEIFRRNKDKIRFEIATQINHAIELFPESMEVYKKIREIGITIYSQNILLKGVNDNIIALVALYNKLREIGIEAHYLFHCVPMKGSHHFRTTVDKGIDLIKKLTNSGSISGRAKPMYALMTDIGKITLYEGSIIKKDEEKNEILVQSFYNYNERINNNPNWQLPKNAFVDENGFIRLWYIDGD